MKKIQHSPIIWTIEDFLSEQECQELIHFSELQGYEAATLSLKEGPKMMKGVRNNYRLIYSDEKLAEKYWQRLVDFCPAQLEDCSVVGLNERFRFYKYEDLQRFKRHIDGRFQRNEQEESRITFMIYLNEDFEGGSTDFDEVSIKAKTGTALCFIHEQKHEGMPVKTGTKYVLRSDVMYRAAVGS